MRKFKILKFELKTSKNESRKFTIFQTNQYGNRKTICQCFPVLLMRYEIFQRKASPKNKNKSFNFYLLRL